MTMFKKSNTLVINTKNSPFEELFNLLTYSSPTATTHGISIAPSTSIQDAAEYKGYVSSSIPMAEKIGAPSRINIPISGVVYSNGTSRTIISVPKEYKNNLEGIETIHIFPNGEIKVSLKYTIHGPKDSDSIFSSIKNAAYTSIINSIESHIISMYIEKRKLCFCRNPKCEIIDLDNLVKHFEI